MGSSKKYFQKKGSNKITIRLHPPHDQQKRLGLLNETGKKHSNIIVRYKALRQVFAWRFKRPKAADFYRVRSQQWTAMLKRDYPKGLPMYKRPAPWRCVVNTHDVAHVLRTSIRTAQRKLEKIRKKNKKGKMAFITVKEFCHHEHLDEAYVQDFLNGIPLHVALEAEARRQGKKVPRKDKNNKSRIEEDEDFDEEDDDLDDEDEWEEKDDE